jgi:AraC-like DNA-binding protein
MTAGDMLYGKRGTPSALRISTGFRMLLVNIPAALVTRKTLLPLPSQAIYVPGRSGPGRILSGLLGAVAESLEELDEIQTGSIEAALAPFLLSALFSDEARRPLGGAAAVRRGALQRLWRAIEDSLCDPGFSLARLSAGQGLSARYVQKLFEETGESFSRYLRRRRLEQCRVDLANPLNARISITTTCFHWGFNDPASFSRAFREEFGLSPRAYRRQALLSSTGSLPHVAADLGSSSPGLQA